LVSTVAPRSGTRTRLGALVYADGQHCIGVHSKVILTYSTDVPHPAYLAAWAVATDRLITRDGPPLSVITIIDSNVRAPSEPSKAAIRATISRHSPNIHALAYVVEGSGFAAAAMRSALSLISLAARYSFPQKVFSSIEDAAQWVTKGVPEGASVPQLIEIAGSMRAAVKASAAAS
jgi:hypothetical protein